MTGIEVWLAYQNMELIRMLSILMGLSLIKAALIIAYFMHLKFERLSLFLSLFPILIMCIILMLIFLGDAYRMKSKSLRSTRLDEIKKKVMDACVMVEDNPADVRLTREAFRVRSHCPGKSSKNRPAFGSASMRATCAAERFSCRSPKGGADA